MSATPASAQASRMTLREALETLHRIRDDQVVVTTMGAAREWPKLSDHPLDFHYIPSAMGHAPALALGLALARPEREVIVFNGDGCMLMSLGCLATIRASGASNYTLIIVDNGLYEVTGGQRTAGAVIDFDFAAAARAARFPVVEQFTVIDDWQRRADEVLQRRGPRLIHWRVAPVDDFQLRAPGPLPERLESFRRALNAPAG